MIKLCSLVVTRSGVWIGRGLMHFFEIVHGHWCVWKEYIGYYGCFQVCQIMLLHIKHLTSKFYEL